MPRIVRLRDDLAIVPDHIATVRLVEPYHAPQIVGHGWCVQATLLFGAAVNLHQWPERSQGFAAMTAESRQLEDEDGLEARTLYERVLAEIALDLA